MRGRSNRAAALALCAATTIAAATAARAQDDPLRADPGALAENPAPPVGGALRGPPDQAPGARATPASPTWKDRPGPGPDDPTR